ncbi:MAG: cyanophycinase [Candidatus Natronoplasma sp.]
MKGRIISMGGNIDLNPDTPLFKEYFNIAQKITPGTPTIGIIPTASATPEMSMQRYTELFESFSSKTVVIDPKDRKEANSMETVEKVERSDAFFFTGGHQLRITTLLGGTELVKKMKERFEEGALVGGTSAGSVCLTSIMISGDLLKRPFVHGQVELTQGLGFIPDMVIDTHFTERGRFPRLIQVVCENPALRGIGIGEGTAAVWDLEKEEFRVIGRNTVAVVDGVNISKNNAHDLEFGEPISVSGIEVHVLSSGARFDYDKCEMFLPEEEED